MLCHAQLNLELNQVGATGAKALGEALKLNGSLTSLNVSLNGLDSASKELLRDAVKDRSGFKLEL